MESGFNAYFPRSHCLFKFFVIGRMLACYAVSVFAVLPQASLMTHGAVR